jgi:hypothetical protein
MYRHIQNCCKKYICIFLYIYIYSVMHVPTDYCVYTTQGNVQCVADGTTEEFRTNVRTGSKSIKRSPRDPNSKDCKLSTEYTEWSECVGADPGNCNGIQYQTQKIATANVGDGKPCPSLNVRTRRCDTDGIACRTCDASAQQYVKQYGDNMRRSAYATDAWAHYANVGRAENYTWQKCK